MPLRVAVAVVGIPELPDVRAHIGPFALFVDAKDEEAAAFYAKYGFTAFPDESLRMVLQLKRVCV